MNYRSFACSEKGAEHEKNNMPCQDSAVDYIDNDLLIVVIAVADGHGSAECFRSEKGSRFAVECAVECIKKFICAVSENSISIEDKQGELLTQLSNSIITSWNDKVEKDYINNPFIPDIQYKVEEVIENKKEYIEQAYGTTLVAAALTDNYWFGLQIGDGKCAVLRGDGTFYQPIPDDEKCFMNITTSMCDYNVSQEFRYCFGVDKPFAIFIGTDGVDNSFEDDEQLYELYRCMLNDFANKGFDTEVEEIKKFLPVLTKKGSGDDVSIAGIIAV